YTGVDDKGHFELLVYDRGPLRLAMMENDASIGCLHFKRSTGAYTTILDISIEPAVPVNPRNAPGASGDSNLTVVCEKTDLTLGTVSDPDGDKLYDSTNNPLGQVDFDADGLSDLLDDDVDNDGIKDTVDDDLNNNGVPDAEENNDLNNDGFPD